jgi:hypothetical protein
MLFPPNPPIRIRDDGGIRGSRMLVYAVERDETGRKTGTIDAGAAPKDFEECRHGVPIGVERDEGAGLLGHSLSGGLMMPIHRPLYPATRVAWT